MQGFQKRYLKTHKTPGSLQENDQESGMAFGRDTKSAVQQHCNVAMDAVVVEMLAVSWFHRGCQCGANVVPN